MGVRPRCRYFVNVAIVALLMIIRFDCIAGDSDEVKCRDIIKALSYLHKSMPRNMSFEGRCKRYVIILMMSVRQGMPRRSVVTQLATLHEHIINSLYRPIDEQRQRSLYLDAIYRYRLIKLEAPFSDLIACLRNIDTTLKGTDLDEQLSLILDLYMEMQESPSLKINLDSVDLSNFDLNFRATLRNIFDKHLYSSPEQSPKNQLQLEKDVARQQKALERRRFLKRINQKRAREWRLQEIRSKDFLRKRRSLQKLKKQLSEAEAMVSESQTKDAQESSVRPGKTAITAGTGDSDLKGRGRLDQFEQLLQWRRNRIMRNRIFRERNRQMLRERDRIRKRQDREILSAAKAAYLWEQLELPGTRRPRGKTRSLEGLSPEERDRLQRIRRLGRARQRRFRERNQQHVLQKQRESRYRRQRQALRQKMLKQIERVSPVDIAGPFTGLMPVTSSSENQSQQLGSQSQQPELAGPSLDETFILEVPSHKSRFDQIEQIRITQHLIPPTLQGRLVEEMTVPRFVQPSLQSLCSLAQSEFHPDNDTKLCADSMRSHLLNPAMEGERTFVDVIDSESRGDDRSQALDGTSKLHTVPVTSGELGAYPDFNNRENQSDEMDSIIRAVLDGAFIVSPPRDSDQEHSSKR